MRASANSLTTVVSAGTPRIAGYSYNAFLGEKNFYHHFENHSRVYLNQFLNAQRLCRGAISKACFPRNKKPSENWYLKHYKIFEKFIIGRGTKKSHRQTQTSSSAQSGLKNIFICFVNSNVSYSLKIKRRLRLEAHLMKTKSNFL